MDLKFFDAHCHVQLSQFDIDRAEVLERMEEGRFGGIVVGVDFATSREALELAEQYGFLWAAIGLHPHDNVAEEFDMTIYRELASDRPVGVAGGDRKHPRKSYPPAIAPCCDGSRGE